MPEITLAAATRNPHKIRELQTLLAPLGAHIVTPDEAGAPPDFAPEENGDTFEQNSRIKATALIEIILANRGASAPGLEADADAPSGSTPAYPEREKGKDNPAPHPNNLNIHGVIADDSGLCVDALGGAPGVYSARFSEIEEEDKAEPRSQSAPRSPGRIHPEVKDSPPGQRKDPYKQNNAKLLHLLRNTPPRERTARFVCVITLITIEDEAAGGRTEYICRGECEGYIATRARGESGFGYDPVFIPTPQANTPPQTPQTSAQTQTPAAGASSPQPGEPAPPPNPPPAGELTAPTFAEMPPEEKNAISHRARALAKLYDALSRKHIDTNSADDVE
jgi:XTP/dITP diphosphohydrolase